MYDRGWKWILRPVDYLTATYITVQAKQAADNDNIGYGQADRLSLWEYITENDHRPSLVIGAPVGFVNVIEAKKLIMSTDVPYIVADGRKGGSTVAAAIVNAMLYTLYQR